MALLCTWQSLVRERLSPIHERSRVDLPGYGIAEWTQMGPPPKGHVYPDEPNPTGERVYRTSQLTGIAAAFRNKQKYNHIANAPHTTNDGRSSRDNRNNNDYKNRNRSDNDRYNHNNSRIIQRTTISTTAIVKKFPDYSKMNA